MTYVMGIDGGGSNVRVVIVSPDLATRGESKGPAANPSAIGHDTAAQNIQQAVREALTDAQLTANDIAAVGL
ncbi:MAG: hypothetical protein H7175_29020, partial [Burkholderiales bacterium]|nr:hypothetical protein [Anaerolineae bacterium]